MPDPSSLALLRPALCAALLVLGACELPQRSLPRTAGAALREVPAVPRTPRTIEETVAVPAGEAVARLDAALRQRTLVPLGPVPPDVPIEARGQQPSPAEWASCPPVTVRDPFAEALRTRTANAGDIRSSATVTVRSAGADSANIAISTAHQATYTNSFTNNPEQRPCRSTGVLEQELLAAARG
jgi:hypothetical protein